MKYIKSKIKILLNQYTQRICRREFINQNFSHINERPVEFSFLFKNLSKICPKTILDVGTGTTALPHLMRNCGFLVSAIDNVHDYWPSDLFNRHYYVIDDDITKTNLTEKFDCITCISTLEHIEEYQNAFKNMFLLLNPGGHLILTFPYSENVYIKNVYALSESTYDNNDRKYIAQSYSRKEIDKLISENGGSIIEQEYWKFWDGDFWTVGNRVIPPQMTTKNDKHQITCLLIKKNS